MASFFPSELGVRGTMRLPNRKEVTGARRLYRSTRVSDIVLRSNSATLRRTRFEIHEPVGENSPRRAPGNTRLKYQGANWPTPPEEEESATSRRLGSIGG